MLVLHRPGVSGAASEVILEGVHVRRETTDESEHIDQVDVERNTDEMQCSNADARVECHMDDGGRRELSLEKACPAIVVIALRVPVLVRIEAYEDVERNQSSVREQSEEVVAGTASRGPSLGRPYQVVDSIHGDDRVPCWLPRDSVSTGLVGILEQTYGNTNHVARSIVPDLQANHTHEDPKCSNFLYYSQRELYPSCPYDVFLGAGGHRFVVDVLCWDNDVAVRVGIEVDERAAFLLRLELAALGTLGESRIMGLCSSARIEVGVWVGDGLACSGFVDVGLVLAHGEGGGGRYSPV